jgi:hypothetical protein
MCSEKFNESFTLENFLTEKQEDAIYDFITNYTFPWSYYSGTVLPSDYIRTNDCIITQGINPPQFSHFIDIKSCPYVDLLAPILNTLANYYNTNLQIMKMKFNLLHKNSDSMHHYPHTDIDEVDENIKTAIYYVNNTDGDTYIFNERVPKQKDGVSVYETVTPKKGKMLVFNSNQFHASSSPINNNIRLVLNIVFKVCDEKNISNT